MRPYGPLTNDSLLMGGVILIKKNSAKQKKNSSKTIARIPLDPPTKTCCF